jgi:Protein of unknown function (DUF1553)/Protein of unknown function (DUF1549)
MPLSRLCFTVLVAVFVPIAGQAATLRILPSEVTLDGATARQRVVVIDEDGGRARADVTATAKLRANREDVVRIGSGGILEPIGDGDAVITATVGEQKAELKVTVRNAKAAEERSFRNDVIPVLTRMGCNSGACHGALAGKGGLKLSLRGYDPDADHFALTRQSLGRRVDREQPEKSLVLLKATMAIAHGGGRRVEVADPEFRTLADWIASGAPGPIRDEARVTALEVFPSRAVLQPKDTMQILVRARYSDGHAVDVTRLARFQSSEELTAGVSAEGKVTVLAPGESAVSVQYGTAVALATVTVPYPRSIEAAVYRDARRNNFVDEHILTKLEELHLPPSPICTDQEFIRRAFLDATGTLPTPEEVATFLADTAKDKRAKLIDGLLKHPAFDDYWAYKWSDLLLITSRRLPQPSVWSFYQYVRQSVADNKPWDRFAREILTASGGSFRNGPANYFVLHKDVTDLTESTAVTFMGMSLTCARCHNHPLEKWTQDQYWGMASLFSRVGLKNGERANSVSVQPLTEGEIPHPRRGSAMPPTPLDGKSMAADSPEDRRRYFADWLTAPENPFFARALVNRVWKNFMGRGLVEAEDDLRETNPPTNGPLLDALARDFVAHKYDVRHLIRTIMNSAAYHRSSAPVLGNESDDRFYSHYLIRRLSAEVLLDAESQVTDVPTPFTHLASSGRDAETPYGGFPLGTRALQLPDSLVASRFLDAFGRPERAQTCSCERSQDSTVGQALHLNNGKTLNEKLRADGSRAAKWAKEKLTDEEVLRQLYRTALCREPKPGEMATFRKLMEEAARDGVGRREVLEDVFWSVLTSKEFIFNR